MCKRFGWVIGTASLSGLIQSIIWMGLGAVGALVYVCAIPVKRYENSGDFFRVTFVKLYFEGRKSNLDGSYLGKFKDAYPNLINWFTADIVFTVMIAYVILNAIHFSLSVLFYRGRHADTNRSIALWWSVSTLIICAVDFVVTYGMILDVLSFRKYLTDNSISGQLDEVPYIPMTLALLSCRFIAGWLWNFCFGCVILMDAWCCRKIIGVSQEEDGSNGKEDAVDAETQSPAKEDAPAEEKTPAKGYGAPYFAYSDERPNLGGLWGYKSTDALWHERSLPREQWEKANEGYVSDEGAVVPDFEHDLKNFESGQRKIKILKPPLGKPVSIPVPPPLPPPGHCNC